MYHKMHLILFILLSFTLNILSQATHSRLHTSVIAITKDEKTSFHTVSWGYFEPDHILDLDAPFTWKNCIIRHSEIVCGLEEGCRFPLPCDNTLCKEAKSYINPICPSLNNITSKYGCRICAVTPFNPISNTCKISQLTTDLVNLYLTDGRNPSPGPDHPFGSRFVVSCAPSSLLRSFPEGVRGVASFSWSSLSFPRQFSYLHMTEKFAVCLPSSSSARGVTFLGDGPFYFLQFPKLDLRTILSYTPIIRKTSKSLGYYIKITQIAVQGTAIGVSSLIKTSSVKLSTLVPYTTLRSDIYKALVKSFSTATKNIPRVTAVQPFNLCFKTGSGYHGVPKIDLETQGGKKWTISGDNSMKHVGNGVSCLAFMDGGSNVEDEIVIGAYQMENNFLFFDLVNRKLGFSSSLLARGTSCNSFNFTEIGN
ncbi:hypothetical protein QVD17_29306 [Tagetes erecta]|uniref:Peptidase A1 domain-containing protein n=1 Tax=Tagetes erecta TaxID=13708 RepID=A0AAD8KBL1_TARER|nr:hypothetical protein QVD17_29306 [Tagetes erecta]